MIKISPDEVIERLKILGVKWSRSTLLRAVKDKLGPSPEIGGGGRGYGRWSDYHKQAYAEFYASHVLLKTYRMDTVAVAKAREAVLTHTFLDDKHVLRKWVSANGDVNFKVDLGPDGKYFLEYAALISKTPGAFKWWEIVQATYGSIDVLYPEVLKFLDSRFKLSQASSKARKWIPVLREILVGLEQVEKFDSERDVRLTAWLQIIANCPNLRTQIKAGMLAEFRDVSDRTIQFLVNEKLPE